MKLKKIRALVAQYDPLVIVECQWGSGWQISYPFDHEPILPPGYYDKGIGIGPDYNRHRDICFMGMVK